MTTQNGQNNPNWKGGVSKKEFICIKCNTKFYGHHSRDAKYCSRKCKDDDLKNKTGAQSKRWTGGIREKLCEGCGALIEWKPGRPYSCFVKQKFCAKQCADKYGLRYSGENHANWKGGTKGRNKTEQLKWSRKILTRDDFTCQECGQRGGDLHAHHIKPYEDYEDLRWIESNGITLCVKCHYKTYKRTVDNENGVNSGKVQNG